MVKMRHQAQTAIETADIIILLTDLQAGLTDQDEEIAKILRKSGKKTILAVNKADKAGPIPAEAYEFHKLGMGELLVISAVQKLGIGELLDAVYELTDKTVNQEHENDTVSVAVIGKPNSGKSSLINRILGEDRVIVSDTAGTTRDAIDTRIRIGERGYVFIDTAGIRKHSKVNDPVEYYSVLRAVSAVKRADVCIILIDAEEGVTEQDTKVAGYAHESGRACLIAVNKWDLIKKETNTLEAYRKEVAAKLAFMSYAPIVFISAKTGQRVERLPELIDYVHDQASMRIPTGLLNDVINDAVAMVPPPTDKGKRLKIFYITQAEVRPPAFVLFINKKELLHFSYKRYIENTIRKNFGFEGSPLKIILREKGERA